MKATQPLSEPSTSVRRPSPTAVRLNRRPSASTSTPTVASARSSRYSAPGSAPASAASSSLVRAPSASRSAMPSRAITDTPWAIWNPSPRARSMRRGSSGPGSMSSAMASPSPPSPARRLRHGTGESTTRSTVSRSGVWRILKRLEIEPAAQLRSATSGMRPRWKRYEKQLPGHRVQVDVKFIEPLIGGAARRKRYYQYTAIDDCTRLRVLRIYERNNQKSAIQFIDYVLAKLPFADRGASRPTTAPSSKAPSTGTCSTEASATSTSGPRTPTPQREGREIPPHRRRGVLPTPRRRRHRRRRWSGLQDRVVEGAGRELATVADAELAEDRRQVGLDRARRDEQLGGDVARRGPADDEAGDLQLVRRQQAVGDDLVGRLAAGGARLGRGPVGVRRRPRRRRTARAPGRGGRGRRRGDAPGAAARPTPAGPGPR